VTAARNVSGLFTALVVNADPDPAMPWLATAYVAGPSLAEAVEGHGVLPARSVAGLAAGLAEGLAAIHAAGVVHRDLKPSNVLLAHDGPRVIDFGISRAMEATTLTQTGMVMGSPGFLSPEQADGAEVGPPSDIFSLGAVLTFAAAGEGPFGSGPTPALMYRVVNREPDLTRVPEELRDLVGRCLSKDPASRPTAAGLLAELDGGQLAADWLREPLVATLARYDAPTQDVATAASAGNPAEPAAAIKAPAAATVASAADNCTS
jgi:serine/threonine protein kinase